MSELSEIKDILIKQSQCFAKQDKKLDDIHFSIYGNKDAGIKGIAKMVEAHEKYISADKKIKLVGAGIASASGIGIWESVKHFFNL